MTKRIQAVLATGLLGLTVLATPSDVHAQRSGVQIWVQNCGRCHIIQPANRYTADQWETIMTDMMIYARLTSDEAASVLQFLQGGAKTVAAAENEAPGPTVIATMASAGSVILRQPDSSGAELFQKQCVACHGADGRGDGPAAAALNPRPSDLVKLADERTDEQLTEVITNGKVTMPGFGNQLSHEDVEALVRYIRSLGRER